LKWIRVQYDQVCPLTCFNGARLFVQFHHSGGHYRRGLDGFHGREPRLDVQLDFAMQAVSRDCLICAGNDRDARFVKCCEHVHPLIERRFCACRGTSGYAGVLQLCRELRCDLLNTWLEARNRVGTCASENLHQCHSRIDGRAGVLEECNRLFGFRGFEIYGGRHTGLPLLWQHNRWNVLNVIDLIHPGFDALKRVHSLGNVPGHRHSQPMSFFANRSQYLRLDRTVDLYLSEPSFLVTVDDFSRLLRSIGANDSERRWTVTVNDPRKQHPRPKTSARLDCVPYRSDKLEFVTDIPAGRDSGSKVDRSPFDLFEVRVHLPEARQYGFSFRI